MRQQSRICTVTFNTTTTILIDVKKFVEPLQAIEEIILEGALETGDSTEILVNDMDKTLLFGTFRWTRPQLYNIKRLKITPVFLAARIGTLTIKYRAVTDKDLPSKTVGASAPMYSRIGDLIATGQKENNYIEGAANFSVDTLHHKAIVPAGKRWFLSGGIVNRDVSGTLEINVNDSTDKVIRHLFSDVAGTGLKGYPDETVLGSPSAPLILDAGEYIDFVFGIAQSTAAYLSAMVIEIEV